MLKPEVEFNRGIRICTLIFISGSETQCTVLVLVGMLASNCIPTHLNPVRCDAYDCI